MKEYILKMSKYTIELERQRDMLLEACKVVVKEFEQKEDYDFDYHFTQAYDAAKQAIASVEGEQNE